MTLLLVAALVVILVLAAVGAATYWIDRDVDAHDSGDNQ